MSQSDIKIGDVVNAVLAAGQEGEGLSAEGVLVRDDGDTVIVRGLSTGERVCTKRGMTQFPEEDLSEEYRELRREVMSKLRRTA